MKKILLCGPDFFDIEYEINPWMHIENQVKANLAHDQHKQLTDLYTKLGAELYDIKAEKGLPDMVYTANFGFVKDKKFIKANFKFEQRRREADLAAAYFEKEFDLETKSLPDDIFYEGEGDHLKVGQRYFMGYGKRSDKEAQPYLQQFLEAEVIPLELVNPYFYHLDTALGPLDNDTAIINEDSFTPDGLKTLKKYFKDPLFINEEDKKVMAPNLMVLDKDVIIGKGISAELKEKLAKRDFKVHEIDMSEFLKGGGSIKCLSLQLWL